MGINLKEAMQCLQENPYNGRGYVMFTRKSLQWKPYMLVGYAMFTRESLHWKPYMLVPAVIICRSLIPILKLELINKKQLALDNRMMCGCYEGLVPDSEKKYIATQGCLESTINDFWNMVYEEDVSIIVMTINENEQDNVSGDCACIITWTSFPESPNIRIFS